MIDLRYYQDFSVEDLKFEIDSLSNRLRISRKQRSEYQAKVDSFITLELPAINTAIETLQAEIKLRKSGKPVHPSVKNNPLRAYTALLKKLISGLEYDLKTTNDDLTFFQRELADLEKGITEFTELLSVAKQRLKEVDKPRKQKRVKRGRGCGRMTILVDA